MPVIYPWYRGYQGTIKVIDRRHKKKNKVQVTIIDNNRNVDKMEVEEEQGSPNERLVVNNTVLDEDGNEVHEEDDELIIEDNEDTRPLLSMITLGKFEIAMNGVITITELPIGRCAHGYHKWLEELIEQKKIVDFRDLSVNNEIYFEIKGFTEPPNYRSLKLQRTMGMSNMVLLNKNNRPVRYDTASDILEAFFIERISAYQERKNYAINHLTEEIVTLEHKIRYIRAVIDGVILIINKRKASIYAGLDELGIPREIYDKSMNHHLSEDDIDGFMNLIQNKINERQILENTSTSEMYLKDLDEFENKYCNIYGGRKKGGPISLSINPSSFPVGKESSKLFLSTNKYSPPKVNNQGINLVINSSKMTDI